MCYYSTLHNFCASGCWLVVNDATFTYCKHATHTLMFRCSFGQYWHMRLHSSNKYLDLCVLSPTHSCVCVHMRTDTQHGTKCCLGSCFSSLILFRIKLVHSTVNPGQEEHCLYPFACIPFQRRANSQPCAGQASL